MMKMDMSGKNQTQIPNFDSSTLKIPFQLNLDSSKIISGAKIIVGGLNIQQ